MHLQRSLSIPASIRTCLLEQSPVDCYSAIASISSRPSLDVNSFHPAAFARAVFAVDCVGVLYCQSIEDRTDSNSVKSQQTVDQRSAAVICCEHCASPLGTSAAAWGSSSIQAILHRSSFQQQQLHSS
jgi:hypothetical protein